jgi:hypothetical protein
MERERGNPFQPSATFELDSNAKKMGGKEMEKGRKVFAQNFSFRFFMVIGFH